MRFYPPLFFQRIWVKSIAADFTSIEVKVHKSIFNINYNKTIFGGTIFSAVDPFYVLLFHQVMLRRGIKTIAWLKSASVQYLKPGHGDLYLKICISQDEINEAMYTLETEGKFIKSYPIQITDVDGHVCAELSNEIYMRDIYFSFQSSPNNS